MIFSHFKDLTVHGTGAMPQTHGNLLAETATYRKKCKRGIKETSIVCANEENASSNGDYREWVLSN